MFRTGLISIILLVLVASDSDRDLNILKFDEISLSYVESQPDVQPIQKAFTICAWVKKLRPGIFPAWFQYYVYRRNYEILFADYGYYFLFGRAINFSNRASFPVGEWKHTCLSWSLTTRTFRAYGDGVFFGSSMSIGERELV